MSNIQWFRLYHRMIDDEKLRLLAFEDRWHFVALLCLKADGLLDEPESNLKQRKLAVKLGVQQRELDEIKRRLSEVGLIDDDMQPVAWDDLQYQSDTSTQRVRKYREKTKARQPETPCNVSRNVSVTVQDTDTDTDITSSLRSDVSSKSDFDSEFEKQFWPVYPRRIGKGQALKAFRAARKQTSLETILTGVRRYAEERHSENPEFTKHASTWLNGQCWLDEPTVKQTSPQRNPKKSEFDDPSIMWMRAGQGMEQQNAAEPDIYEPALLPAREYAGYPAGNDADFQTADTRHAGWNERGR